MSDQTEVDEGSVPSEAEMSMQMLPPGSELKVVEGNVPAQLMAIALNANADIAKLERLMEMQTKWEAKEAKKAFFDALSRFQAAVPEVEKAKEVSFGKTHYSHARLSDIEKAIRVPMVENGLSKRWEIDDKGDTIAVTCIITHEAGHSESTTMQGPPDTSGQKNLMQQRASTVTYLQRYTLIGALGLSTADIDDDGVGSAGREEPPAPTAGGKDVTGRKEKPKAFDTEKARETILAEAAKKNVPDDATLWPLLTGSCVVPEDADWTVVDRDMAEKIYKWVSKEMPVQ